MDVYISHFLAQNAIPELHQFSVVRHMLMGETVHKLNNSQHWVTLTAEIPKILQSTLTQMLQDWAQISKSISELHGHKHYLKN